ncbi:hypothetical protein V8F33_011612 [Rhypophila sp. PSN 637]
MKAASFHPSSLFHLVLGQLSGSSISRKMVTPRWARSSPCCGLSELKEEPPMTMQAKPPLPLRAANNAIHAHLIFRLSEQSGKSVKIASRILDDDISTFATGSLKWCVAGFPALLSFNTDLLPGPGHTEVAIPPSHPAQLLWATSWKEFRKHVSSPKGWPHVMSPRGATKPGWQGRSKRASRDAISRKLAEQGCCEPFWKGGRFWRRRCHPPHPPCPARPGGGMVII